MFAAVVAAPADAAPAPVAWCGTDTSATDRKPDAVAARQIGVIYAFPAGGADRFSALASPILTDLAAVDAWWRREDPTRAPRFDLAAFPACATAIGRLDFARVPLQRGPEFYAPFPGRFGRLNAELTGPPFAFANRFKKYLVFYDGPVEEPNICGTASGRPDDGASFAIVYLAACGNDAGAGALNADVAVHELLHTLGAVPTAAPNTCAQSQGHVCDSPSDIMFPSTRGEPLDLARLDAGRNDYYGHGGSWFDVQDSGWLTHLDAALHPLTVAIEGVGRVDSLLPGIECPPACSVPWESGTVVGLTATPGAGSRFLGWAGPCEGTGECALRMDAPQSVTARFGVPVQVAIRVLRRGGTGTVVSEPAGVECSSACDVELVAGQAVRLRALPDPGSRFLGWGGACTGRGVCALTASAGLTVTAAFGRASFRANVRTTGPGRVTSRPAGISCGPRCGASFRAGTAVRLIARPARGARFVGWSGACRGRRPCVLRMTADRAVRATFRR